MACSTSQLFRSCQYLSFVEKASEARSLSSEVMKTYYLTVGTIQKEMRSLIQKMELNHERSRSLIDNAKKYLVILSENESGGSDIRTKLDSIAAQVEQCFKENDQAFQRIETLHNIFEAEEHTRTLELINTSESMEKFNSFCTSVLQNIDRSR